MVDLIGADSNDLRDKEDAMNELAVGTFGDRTHDLNRRNVEIRQPLAVSNSKRELDRRLDQALMDTFPASDPVSIMISVRN
jgi:hypothetical protein